MANGNFINRVIIFFEKRVKLFIIDVYFYIFGVYDFYESAAHYAVKMAYEKIDYHYHVQRCAFRHRVCWIPLFASCRAAIFDDRHSRVIV